MGREKLGSRLGFILLSAGCAIGIGNVWKFPYVVGQNGGGVFVLIYLIFLAILGIPVLSMEFAIGRAAQKSPVKMYQELEPKGTVWHIHGKAAMIGGYLLMMFYTTVAGWMVRYFVSTAAGDLSGLDASGISQKFNQMLSDAPMMILYMGIVIAAAVLVCSIGLKNGLERVTKVMMLALLGIMVILAINSFFMPGGEQGIAFYLMPDFEEVQKIGIGTIIVNAMNQAFFSLSVGMGGMAIFGSYIGKERSLMGESLHIIALDTFVAVLAGIIIFPACFTYGLEVTAGPSLLFDTMAGVFNNMAGGRWWGALFFLFMVFAALSTVLGVCENILAMVRELTGWTRPKGCVVCGAGIFLLALTTALGYSVLHFQPFAPGSAWLDFWDFIVSNNVLPLGTLVLALFCCNRLGWGWENFVNEANTGKGLKVQPWMKPVFRYFVPCAIAFIYVYGMVTFHWR